MGESEGHGIQNKPRLKSFYRLSATPEDPVMSRRRPGTAGSVRSTTSGGRNALSALKVRSGARPGSAKDWFEAYNHRRNEEALRLDDWRNTANNFQKRQFQTQVYNTIVESNINRQRDQADWR